ncbi:nitrate regulatory protein [Microbulbifer celer]|uniref:Nitrate- and nitrite sensing domain-containing protein n=1 Tax=Microbulbifer celer TaxID=435905 RepID=A0ABW3U2U2_9GAMM|nr:nitrate regulatory protein [Microbulbifer celer]UFN56138.1 nitrate- and nitrite sensing domain-containing protein [Microbulbifer celer]
MERHTDRTRGVAPVANTPGAEKFLLAAKRAEICSLRQLAESCELVTAVSDLVHQLQRERGMSNIFLASGGARFRGQWQEQMDLVRRSSERLQRQLYLRYLKQEGAAGMRLLNSIAYSLQGLDDLDGLRVQVEQLAIAPLDSTRAFCRLIGGLLSIVFEAADVADDPAVTRMLVAMFNFMQAKEYAGQERAWGAIGFARSRFDSVLHDRLSHLQEAQHRSVEVFIEFAEASDQARWQGIENSPPAQDLNRLRRVIRGLADGEPIAAELSEVWYELATQRIDCMHSLEDHLAGRLLDISRQRVAEAESELEDHHARIHALKAIVCPNTSPLTMLSDPEVPGLYGAGEGAAKEAAAECVPPAQGLTPNLARSIYDLIRGQAHRIKQMGDELNDARRALTERKQVERAKGVLMRNLGLSEAAAYRKMQRRAMACNLRLADVAATIIEIGEKAAEKSTQA